MHKETEEKKFKIKKAYKNIKESADLLNELGILNYKTLGDFSCLLNFCLDNMRDHDYKENENKIDVGHL